MCRQCAVWAGSLTDGGEDVGEAEVVHGVEGQQVVEELFLLVVAAQESVALVQFSVGRKHLYFQKYIHECIGIPHSVVD